MMRPLFVSLLTALLMSCGGEAEHAPEHGGELSARVAYTPAEVRERTPFATLPADVVSRPGGGARLGPPAIGRLDAWAVQPGDVVSAGDTLAWLISPDLSSREADVAAARSEVARARIEAEQLARAAARGVRSQSDAAVAAAQLSEAQARLGALQRQLSATRDTTTREGDRWAWRSPSDGVVQTLHCEIGALPDRTGCVSLVQPGAAWVRVRVPERHDGLLGPDITGEVVLADGGRHSLVLAATGPALDPHTRTRELFFTTPDAAPLGASGRATLTAPAPAGATVVPEEALTRVDGEPHVMRRRGEGPSAEPVSVTELGREPGFVHLTGLEPGDPVAVRGVFLLKSLVLLDEESAGHSH